MNMISRRLSGLVVATLLFIAGCELATPFPALNLYEINPIEYTTHVQRLILDVKCARCHAGADAANGLRLDSWQNLIAGSDFGEAVIPFDDENSLLVGITSRLVGGPHPFELGADTLTTAELDFLRRWIDNGAAFDDGSIPYEDASQLLYVPNQDDALISVIDVESKLVIRTVDLVSLSGGFTPNAKPHHVAVEPQGENWYVSLIGDNKVVKFSRTNLYSGDVDMETPGMLAINPQTDHVYAARSLTSVSPPQSIGRISRSSLDIQEVDVFYQRPHALVVDPSGEFVHTGSLAENRIMTVNTNNDEVTFTLVSAPFHSFVQFGLSPDGDRMVATGQESNQVVILDTSEPPGIRRIGAIEVGNQPWHPVWTPDGKNVYVGNRNDNTVSVIDMDNFTIAQTISGDGLAQPHGAAVSADGEYVFISNRNTNGAYQPRFDLGNNRNKGTVVVINTATNEIEKVIEVGRFPAGLSMIHP